MASISSSSTAFYTPFECFPYAPQTASGLLELEKNEVTILHKTGVELRSAMATSTATATDDELPEPMVPVRRDGTVDTQLLASNPTWRDRRGGLLLQLTTHRVVLWKQQMQQQQQQNSDGDDDQRQYRGGGQQQEGRFVSLALVLSAAAETAWFKSPKVLLSTVMGDVLLVFKEGQQQQHRDDFLEALDKALSRKEWEKTPDASKIQRTTKAMTSHKVGVDAILSKNKIRHQQARKLTTQALAAQDADALMKEATELVSIIQKYMATIERQELNAAAGSGGSSSSAGGEGAAAQRQLVSLLQDMGMTSCLNKSDFVGQLDEYYSQLARQIADFIAPKLDAAGGVLTLTDVYCFFNRARASNLLSPEDLRQAVAVMDRPGSRLGMSTRTFPSGLIVLQLDKLQDATELLRREAAGSGVGFGSGIHELDAARLLNTSAFLANEQLLAAESAGVLVRDSSSEMTRFFDNKFNDWVRDDGTIEESVF